MVSSTNSAGVKFQNWFPVFDKPIKEDKSELEPKFPNNSIKKFYKLTLQFVTKLNIMKPILKRFTADFTNNIICHC